MLSVTENEEQILIRQDLHAHPELRFEEKRTAGIVADYLAQRGFRPRRGFTKTGVGATLDTGRPGPSITLRAGLEAVAVQVAGSYGVTATLRFHGFYPVDPIAMWSSIRWSAPVAAGMCCRSTLPSPTSSMKPCPVGDRGPRRRGVSAGHSVERDERAYSVECPEYRRSVPSCADRRARAPASPA